MTWHRVRAPKATTDSVREKARNRLQRLPTPEVVDWSEQAVNGCHRALDAFRRDADGAALQEARQAVSMLAGAMDVIEARQPAARG